MYSVIQIKANEGIETVNKIDMESPYLTLQQLWKWTDCDCISIIKAHPDVFKDILPPFTNILIVIDDEGKLKYRPENLIGTKIYGQFPFDFLVGDIVLTTDQRPTLQDDPDCYGIPEDQAQKIMQRIMELMNN